MSGLQLRDQIISERPDVFVAVMSGDTFGGNIPAGVEVIQKPFSAAQLRERVDELLREHENARKL